MVEEEDIIDDNEFNPDESIEELDSMVEGEVEEKSEEEVEDKRVDENIKKKQNKQIKWAIILMISLVAIILGVPPIVKYYFNTFEYIGLEFQKTKLGELIFYSTKFPVLGVQGQAIGSYAINFRNDPRDLEYIKVDIIDDKIKFIKYAGKGYAPVYLSLDPYMDVCEDRGIALLNLAGFLKDSGLEVKSAVTDKSYAEENGEVYKKCESSSTVIMVKEGEKTAINEVGKNCYEILFKDCEILQATEKFQLIILEEYVNKFKMSQGELIRDVKEPAKKEKSYIQEINGSATVTTKMNIKTLPEHEVIIKILNPNPGEGESNALEYLEWESGVNGEFSVNSYATIPAINIVVILEKNGERVEVNGKTVHLFENKETGGEVNLEIINQQII